MEDAIRTKLSVNRLPVAASRQSAAIRGNKSQRRSAETPLRQGSWSQCMSKSERKLPGAPVAAVVSQRTLKKSAPTHVVGYGLQSRCAAKRAMAGRFGATAACVLIQI